MGHPETLVFDEIDTRHRGRAAEAVGRKTEVAGAIESGVVRDASCRRLRRLAIIILSSRRRNPGAVAHQRSPRSREERTEEVARMLSGRS